MPLRPRVKLQFVRAARPVHGKLVLRGSPQEGHLPEERRAPRRSSASSAWGAAVPWLLGAAACGGAAFLWLGGPHTANSTPGRAGLARAEMPAVQPLSTLRASNLSDDGLFGLVGDVALARGGGAYVLDVMNKRVGVFGTSGVQTRTLGREGRGPGELMGPIALAVDERDDLLVLDEMTQRIDLFSGRDGEWQRSIAVDYHPHDMCFLAGRLYVLGARRGYLLHELSPEDGRVLRSFAPDSASLDGLVAGYRARGYLACGPDDEITFLPSLRPDVARYSATSGSLIATAQIPGFQGIRVERTRGGAVTFSAIGRKRNHYASSIVALPGGDRLIQIGFLRPQSPTDHEFESIATYRLSRADGQIRPVVENLPRIIAARGDSLYSTQTHPFPAVAVIAAPGLEKGS